MSYSLRFNEIWHADVCGDLFLHSLLYKKKDHVLHISLHLTLWFACGIPPRELIPLEPFFAVCCSTVYIQYSLMMGLLLFSFLQKQQCIFYASSPILWTYALNLLGQIPRSGISGLKDFYINFLFVLVVLPHYFTYWSQQFSPVSVSS